MKNNKDNKGFSLTETIVYVSVLVVALGIITTFAVETIRASARLVEAKDVQQSLRPVMSRISQDVKTARQVVSASPDRLELIDAAGRGVSYEYVAADETIYHDDGLVRTGLAEGKVRISAARFVELNGAVRIEITMGADSAAYGRTGPYRLSEASVVALRQELY